MKNLGLFLVILLGVYYFLGEEISVIGGSVIFYGVILWLDWLTINFFAREYSSLVKFYKKHFWIFKKDEANLIYMWGVFSSVFMALFPIYGVLFESREVEDLLFIFLLPINYFGMKWLAKTYDSF